jgi:hypothetical protein
MRCGHRTILASAPPPPNPTVRAIPLADIELVVQFGYIVLFAAALPMASLFALIANMIEMRTGTEKCQCWAVGDMRRARVCCPCCAGYKYSTLALFLLSQTC